jgi:hypothetical protein
MDTTPAPIEDVRAYASLADASACDETKENAEVDRDALATRNFTTNASGWEGWRVSGRSGFESMTSTGESPKARL